MWYYIAGGAALFLGGVGVGYAIGSPSKEEKKMIEGGKELQKQLNELQAKLNQLQGNQQQQLTAAA